MKAEVMKPLALPKLPDRNPVKRTIVCEPELNRALEEYALLYRETYGEAEPVDTLIPFMLSAFLARDRAFLVFRKGRAMQAGSDPGNDSSSGHRRRRGRRGVEPEGAPSSS
jgi:hypothetical protein